MDIAQNTIGCEWSSEGNITFQTTNPVTNAKNTIKVVEATEAEISKACALAATAFKVYRKVDGPTRAKFLEEIASELEAAGDTLINMYMLESGLPKGRAEGERGRMLGQLRMFASLIKDDTWRAPNDNSNENKTKSLLVPIGPIAVFGASNFPFAFSTAGGDTASALAAGNPVIVKSHPMHAVTGALVANAIATAAKNTGMPAGVFSSLNSKDVVVGTQLVKNEHIKAVGFTGSLKGGRALYDIAAQRPEPIPVFAEMGSINPVIISEEAIKQRKETIAQDIADSVMLGVGQFCTNPGLILATKGEETSKFIEILGSKIEEKVSDSMLHENIFKHYNHGTKMMMEHSGVTLVKNSEVSTQANVPTGTIATTEGHIFLENTSLHKEVFGPFSLVVVAKDTDELITIIENLEGQLTGTIIAESSETNTLLPVMDALQERVGRIVFNGVPTGVEVCGAMTHGGPYPASTDSRFTAVGTEAIKRWVRPVSYQNVPDVLLPKILR